VGIQPSAGRANAIGLLAYVGALPHEYNRVGGERAVGSDRRDGEGGEGSEAAGHARSPLSGMESLERPYACTPVTRNPEARVPGPAGI
jgi:hypothetical protein